SGRRCSRTRGFARRCWTASQTGRISSRLEQNRTVFGGPWRDGRRRKPRRNSWASLGCGQRKGLKRRPFPCNPIPASNPERGKEGFMTWGGPNESIKGGPNQVVKRKGTSGESAGFHMSDYRCRY